MNVLIVGHGFVGKAISGALKSSVNLSIADPNLDNDQYNFKDNNIDIIFICLPTPMHKDGDCNSSIVEAEMKISNKLFPEALKVIKSTLPPNKLKDIEQKYNSVVYNPEFLTEKNAISDFINSDFQIFGGNIKLSKLLERFYKKHTLCKSFKPSFTTIEIASLVKYTINSFLATKVIFFNELKKLFNDRSFSHDQFKEFIEILSLDARVGSSHMNVPGHDGRLGFGGACFPKDTQAFIKFFEKNNLEFELLHKAIQINKNIRSSYDEIMEREKDQNISFIE